MVNYKVLNKLCDSAKKMGDDLRALNLGDGILGISVDGYRADMRVNIHASSAYVKELKEAGATLKVYKRRSIDFPYEVRTSHDNVDVYCICTAEEVKDFET